jgi:hypothetical protein
MTSIDQYYQNQAAGLPYFAGPATQQGHGLGGLFGKMFRAVAPLFKRVAPLAKSAVKTALKEAALTGADILQDVVHGEDLGEAAAARAAEARDRLLQTGAMKLSKMVGSKGIKGKKRKKDIFSTPSSP